MADQPSVRAPGVDVEGKKIRFDFIKSNAFRVIYVQGAIGGVGPRGNIQMAVWNERWPIPRQTTHELGAEGRLGHEITKERVTREAVVREVEAELVMDLPTAQKLKDWLQKQIEHAEGTKASKEGT
ncbi:MAG: hypothetical protein NTW87_28355 [Planctomycetota bacterium]|nr:hypothetical protein [Planctomycetota bacterium]